ncbi:hypothetical protein Cni_G07810 [Canna indica]|uniref:Uncharacterized protein n=1 Tax=Canna indica TaxID=4628 RepID=A0AAQ3Q661_9LILI|nr:hypothetical protein Cni_G07810 [Canna indica]
MAPAITVSAKPSEKQQKETETIPPEEEEEEEEEEEFFELDLEELNKIAGAGTPSSCFQEQLRQATRKALLANCLLPIHSICNAIPINDSSRCSLQLCKPLTMACNTRNRKP